jgi:integrase
MAALTEKKLQLLSQQTANVARREWDGNGLYADVSPNGVISFAMKFRRDGKERREGIGRWPSVTLVEARKRARGIRVSLDRGEAPKADSTFKEAADKWTKDHKGELAARTMVQIKRYLDACTKEFGKKLVTDVKPSDLLAVIRDFEQRGAIESAKRVRIYASAVFAYALPIDHPHANPALKLKEKGLMRKSPPPVHHAAMPAKEIPAFLGKLAAANLHPSIRGALKFIVLTALRTGEVLEFKWTDIAKDGRSLTIPAERMKGGKPHTVFFSKQARAVVEDIREFSAGRDHVFPGRDPDGPLSSMAMLMTLRRMTPGHTVHGFRSAFSTWAHQKGAAPHVVERCLAHASADKVAAAYNRHTYDREAAHLWQKWADAISS